MELTALKESSSKEEKKDEFEGVPHAPHQVEEDARQKVANSLSEHFGQPMLKEDVTPITDEIPVRLEGNSLKVDFQDALEIGKNVFEDKVGRHVVGGTVINLGEGEVGETTFLKRLRERAKAVGAKIIRKR